MTERNYDFVSGATDPNDHEEASVSVPAICPIHSEDSEAIQNDEIYLTKPKLRRSNRDTHVRSPFTFLER